MFRSKTIKIIISTSLFLILAIGIGVGTGIYNESKSRNFGTTLDPVHPKREKHECCGTINTQGLASLNAYGSGIIYYPAFKKYLEENREKDEVNKLYIVNLIDEEIYYYKDRSLRWYGARYKEKELGQFFFARKPIKGAYKMIVRVIYGTPPVNEPSKLQTERQIVKEMGAEYYVPLLNNKHWLHNQGFMEDLIRFFEKLPQDAHVYFHCIHGRGKTTTFLVLYETFRNAKNVSLLDIANRQYCLGREDVLNTEFWATGTWSKAGLIARKDLIERFYAFMTDKKGYGHQSWTQWNEIKGTKLVPVVTHRRDENE